MLCSRADEKTRTLYGCQSAGALHSPLPPERRILDAVDYSKTMPSSLAAAIPALVPLTHIGRCQRHMPLRVDFGYQPSLLRFGHLTGRKWPVTSPPINFFSVTGFKSNSFGWTPIVLRWCSVDSFTMYSRRSIRASNPFGGTTSPELYSGHNWTLNTP